MAGFWTRTPEGYEIHIHGDAKMSERTRLALCELMDKAAQMMTCVHVECDLLYMGYGGPHYTFYVQRCHQCAQVIVRVMGDETGDGEKLEYLQTLPTRVAPWSSGRPDLGYAYYWHFDGLNHSTPAIAPAPRADG